MFMALGRDQQPERFRRPWYPRKVGEHEMTAEVLAAERTAILERLARLELEVSGIVESGSAGADDEHDPEGATLAFERQHATALLSRARHHLAEVEAAMIRLADGEYGSCVGCGELIDAARLAARPTATTCIRCATQA
jgi:RNA polymerase-binding transcription factor DksA